ncbi:hypothetical protein B0O99DRAFT_530958 [Bisporella sp. PMI_857]|nr:hypothetical protein B0O99DRAFT_530958 [Bisporella sp. PMI_857]
MPLIVEDGDTSFRIKNTPGGETNRLLLTGYDRHHSTATRGRLFHVVHGTMSTKNSDNEPATLIVFEWLFVPGRLGHRFREVEIDITFSAYGCRPGISPRDDLSAFTPEVKSVAPDMPIISCVSERGVTMESSMKEALSVGYTPYVSFSPEKARTVTEVTERTDYRFIAGYPAFVENTRGAPNSLHWTLRENAPRETGTPHCVRTAVLLRRRDRDGAVFSAKIKTSANISVLYDAVDSLRKAVGTIPSDDPVYFDPKPVADVEHSAAVL